MAVINEKSQPTARIDKIPYDAPLIFSEPTKKWRDAQLNALGSKSRKTITDAEVPGCDLTGKWIIITGSNNGIGREAAIQFAKWGANLILACRNLPPTSHEQRPEVVVEECLSQIPTKSTPNEEQVVEWWEIDMGSLASVESFANRWLQSGRALNILCNNAGMGAAPRPVGSKPITTEDGFEVVHQVNFLSHVLLTMRLLPSLAQAPEPRVICTTSCFHYLGRYGVHIWNGEASHPVVPGGASGSPYQDNKLYFQIWLTELQSRLLQHDHLKHITVNGVHPGIVATGIWNLGGSGIWHTIKQWLIKIAAFFIGINSQQGSVCITHAATAPEAGPNPEVQGVGVESGGGGGRYFSRIWEQRPMPHCFNWDARLRVWRKVDEELGLRDKGLLDDLGVWSTDCGGVAAFLGGGI